MFVSGDIVICKSNNKAFCIDEVSPDGNLISMTDAKGWIASRMFRPATILEKQAFEKRSLVDKVQELKQVLLYVKQFGNDGIVDFSDIPEHIGKSVHTLIEEVLKI